MNFAQIIILNTLILFSGSVFAASYTCNQGKAERKILVSYAGENKKAPCDVKYQKEGETEGTVKWSAKAESSYCEQKSDAFAEKLKGMGWVCTPQAN